MTCEEARAWMERWKIVNEFTDAESRATTPEERFRDLETLVASADLFPPAADEMADERAPRWSNHRRRRCLDPRTTSHHEGCRCRRACGERWMAARPRLRPAIRGGASQDRT